MSSLPTALPLALAAAIYPPALLALLLLMAGERPQALVLAFYAGALTMTLGYGLLFLTVLDGSGASGPSNRSVGAGVEIALGAALLVAGAWMWRRRSRVRDPKPTGAPGRMDRLTREATRGPRRAFTLGVAMYAFPSPIWVAAVTVISESGDPFAGRALAVVLCTAAVLVLLEVPVIVLLVRPDAVEAGLRRSHAWLTAHASTLAAGLALAVGVALIVRGVARLA